LQTPLTIIRGELDCLKKNTLENTSLFTFEKSIERISNFIHTLLQLSKLDALHSTQNTKICFSELIEEVTEYVSTLAQEQNITVVRKITPGVKMQGNREQLEQLITNLLSNAIKYTAHERKVIIELDQKDGRVVLNIKDTGNGIPAEQIPKLFKRFYRNSDTQKQGTGLGLAICDRIVKNHQGTISISSELGRGTIVQVTFIVSG
jgi:signal transduction histidine kinase